MYEQVLFFFLRIRKSSFAIGMDRLIGNKMLVFPMSSLKS